ncbi:MAG: hypothetical protein HS116_26210 [Planctomycetes bacterium]|nr:hypothetical protein [Planctomycetota bacterium]
MDFRFAAARHALGHLTPEEMIDAAHETLDAGGFTPALGLLAYAQPLRWETDPLFESALKELSIEIPDRQGAVRLVAIGYARQIVAGSIAPKEGVFAINRALLYEDSSMRLIRGFVDLAEEWWDISGSSTISLWEAQTVEYAQEWLREHAPDEQSA